jgi:hypothetical protein
MVKHGYTSCAQCHSDPSGAGVLTAYGRAQGEILLRTPYGTRSDEWEPGFASKPFFGVIPVPASVDVGYSARMAQMAVRPSEGEDDDRLLGMQGDLRAHVRAGPARIYASAAVSGSDRTDPVRITKNDEEDGFNLISREHWIGYAHSDKLLVRGGRMALPFGIRQVEHYLWSREATRTDIDSTSQHGVSAVWSGPKLRAELMGIAGNFSVSPDEYRERGYSGFAEWAFTEKYAAGVSSLVATAEADLAARRPVTRMAHGVFARGSPHPMIAILGEATFLSRTLDEEDPVNGFVTMLQADVEPYQGIHLVLTEEAYQPDTDGLDPQLGIRGSVVRYFAPHADLRVDAVRRGIPIDEDGNRTHVNIFLFQLHVFL